jgi:hypothetical protein
LYVFESTSLEDAFVNERGAFPIQIKNLSYFMLGKAGMALPLVYEHKPWGNHPWSLTLKVREALGSRPCPIQ